MKPISLRVSKRDQLEAEQSRLTAAWCKQLVALADARAYFARLRGAPPSEWRSQECAEALARMRHHETTAAAFSTLLEPVERALRNLDAHAEATARAHRLLARRRR
jgi:hypothetical protein